jgi:hypothetical protein
VQQHRDGVGVTKIGVAAIDGDDVVVARSQQLDEVGAVLPGRTGDECLQWSPRT